MGCWSWDEQDARESNPHHHHALEVGALKDLVVTPSLPGAPISALRYRYSEVAFACSFSRSLVQAM